MNKGKFPRERTTIFYLLLLAVIFVNACATPPEASTKPPTVPWVDLARYQGKWYEIARLPMFFQRNCLHSWATYTILEPGKISVKNECTTRTGRIEFAEGHAVVVDPRTNARLKVTFTNWISRLFPSLTKGDYWIFYLDPDYQTAIVGTPNRKFLWILARTPGIADSKYVELVEFSQKLGFSTDSLIRAQPAPFGG